jgi:uncharacterized membrane protein (DUF106 family)
MAQEELFGADKTQELKNTIKELDSAIAKALKAKDFAKAKSLTEQQSRLLQELVEMNESRNS